MAKPDARYYSPDPDRSSPSIVQQPPGSHIGAGAAGGLLNDGTVPLDNLNILHNRNSISSALSDSRPSNEVPRPFGVSQEGVMPKYPGLKSAVVPANGGIGVSYSSLVLGGGNTSPSPMP